MTYFTYKNTYENATEFEFNVDISIKTGEILELAHESIESLTYIGESLEPISYLNKTIEFEVFYDHNDNDQKYILEIETEPFLSVSITFGKIQCFSIEKEALFSDHIKSNLISF
jgi:hypothetical protein